VGQATRIAGVSAAALIFAALGATPALAERAVAVTPANALVSFDTTSPGTATSKPITGLASNSERVIGIDVRPATGQLYAVTVPIGIAANALVRTYTLDPNTAAAAFVGSIPNTVPGAADVATGLTFGFPIDRMRVVNANNENFRINPNNGALAGDDTNLTYTPPMTGPVVAAAHDANTPSSLWVIDRGQSRLGLQGGAFGSAVGGENGGLVSNVGSLGVALNATADAGFDISAMTGTAFAAFTVGSVTGLYTVNLVSGAATLIGSFPAALGTMASLAILPPAAAPPPPASPSTPQPPPPPDLTRPSALIDLAATVKMATLQRSRLAFAFSCDEACTATAKLAAGRTTLATGRATLAKAGVSRLRLTSTRAGRKLLAGLRRGRATRRNRSLKTKLTVEVKDLAGNRRTLTRKLTLTR
jgi:Domain of unknown function (DUF4394)